MRTACLAKGPSLGWVGWQWIKGEEEGLEDVSRKSCHGWMSGALGRCGNQGEGQGDAVQGVPPGGEDQLAAGNGSLSRGGPPLSSSLGSGKGMSNWRQSLFGTVWGRAQGLAPLGQEEEGTGRRTRMCWARGRGRGAGANVVLGGRGRRPAAYSVSSSSIPPPLLQTLLWPCVFPAGQGLRAIPGGRRAMASSGWLGSSVLGERRCCVHC